MSDVKAIYTVVMAMQPSMQDCADNESFQHWIDYGQELDDLLYIVDTGGVGDLMNHMNHIMGTKLSSSAQHHACTDVASTLESLYPASFACKFNY